MPSRKPNRDKPITPQQARAMMEQSIRDLLTGKDPGSVTFRLKPTKKTNETYPIKMTELQRYSLLYCTRLKNKIQKKIREAADGTQTLEFTRRELDHLSGEIGQAAYYALSPHKKRLMAVMQKVDDHITSELAGLFDETPTKAPTRRTKGTATVYQFKITLLDIEPPIWRRIQMTDGTLADLHECIQGAFGWWNYHLHQFLIDGKRYGPTPPGDFEIIEGMLPEEDLLLREVIPASSPPKRWDYEYDFGDGWRHEVLFEGHPPIELRRKYPWCVEGARACPPEDCGGPWVYAEYLEAISDPNHERHDELMEWRGPFDPEKFDAKKATREMRRKK